MLTINWVNHHAVPDVKVEMLKNYFNAYRTPKYVFVEKDFESWDTKIHGPRNYLQSFCVAALIDKCGTTKHYPPAMF